MTISHLLTLLDSGNCFPCRNGRRWSIYGPVVLLDDALLAVLRSCLWEIAHRPKHEPDTPVDLPADHWIFQIRPRNNLEIIRAAMPYTEIDLGEPVKPRPVEDDWDFDTWLASRRRRYAHHARKTIGKALEPLAIQKAKDRQREAGKNYGRGKPPIGSGKLPTPISQPQSGRASDEVASALGVKRKTYAKAEAVVDHGEPALMIDAAKQDLRRLDARSSDYPPETGHRKHAGASFGHGMTRTLPAWPNATAWLLWALLGISAESGDCHEPGCRSVSVQGGRGMA